jgi:hypothetical protein
MLIPIFTGCDPDRWTSGCANPFASSGPSHYASPLRRWASPRDGSGTAPRASIDEAEGRGASPSTFVAPPVPLTAERAGYRRDLVHQVCNLGLPFSSRLFENVMEMTPHRRRGDR